MRALSSIYPATALALALLAGASSALGNERDRGQLENVGEIFLVYMPQIEKCVIIYDGYKAGGPTEVACTDEFRALAKSVRFPDPSE